MANYVCKYVTRSSCLIWQIISFILQPNKYGCVYACIRFGKWAWDRHTEDADFGKKKNHLNKQNCRIWSTKNPHAYIETNDLPKTSHCLVGILVQRHNWSIFLLKWEKERPLQGRAEWIFVHKNWKGRYWQHLVSTGRRYVPHSRSYTRCFAPCFWRSHYQQQSWCRLATSELRFNTVGLLFVGCRQR